MIYTLKNGKKEWRREDTPLDIFGWKMPMIDYDSEIAFDEDIIRETSERIGIEYGKVEHVYRVIIRFWREKLRFSDCVTFYVPFMGRMYTKYKPLLQRINYLRRTKRARSEEELEYHLQKKAKIDEYQEVYDILTKDRKINRFAISHNRKSRHNCFMWTGGKTLDELQKYQNNFKTRRMDRLEKQGIDIY